MTLIQWYSPPSAQWSIAHIDTKDWLDSEPSHQVTVCGRRPRNQHRHIRYPAHGTVRVCKHCQKGTVK